MTLNLLVLKYAATVRQAGSFSAAARVCGVSQPTVSNGVAELEESLGARLFDRTTRRLSVTPAGERLLALVDVALEAVADLEREAHVLKNPARRLVRVGFSPLVGAKRLATLFEPFASANADVEIVYKECSQGDMEGRLDANTIDMVCGTGIGRAKSRGRQVLYRDALRWIPPHGTLLGDRTGLREVATRRLVLTDGSCGLASATRELFAHARIAIDEYAGHAMSYAALEEWAELGIGGAILPAAHIRKVASASLESSGKPILLSYEMVWRRDFLVSQHLKSFVRYVQTIVPRLVKGLGGTR
jgi:LysR family transcriptional regulator, hydrogen peroxide-inducible genes activator